MLSIAFYIVVLAGLLIGTVFRPPLAYTALACVQVLDFWGQMSSPLIAKMSRLTNILVVVIVLLGFAKAFFTRVRREKRYFYVHGMLLALWGYSLVSVLWTMVPEKALGNWFQYGPYIVLNGFFVPYLFKRSDDISLALRGVVTVGTLIIGVVAATVNFEYRYMVSFWNPNAAYWNALEFSQLCGYTVISAVLLNRRKGAVWLLVRVIAVAVSLIVTIKSGTRGQFALMVLFSLVFLPFSRPVSSIKTYLWMIFIVVVGFGVASYAFEHFASDEFGTRRWGAAQMSHEWEGRLIMWERLISYWWAETSHNPLVVLFGLGNSSSMSADINGHWPHNVMLEVLGEEGLVGFVLYICLAARCFYQIPLAFRLCDGDVEKKGLVGTLSALFCFSFFLSFKSGSLVGYCDLFLFGLLLERQINLLLAEQSGETVKSGSTLPAILGCDPTQSSLNRRPQT